MNKPKIAFFGGEPLGAPALQALIKTGLTQNSLSAALTDQLVEVKK